MKKCNCTEYVTCNERLNKRNFPLFVCTRKKGHKGNHRACGGIYHRYAEWTQKDKVVHYNSLGEKLEK